jgi:hypothetical protein
VDDQAAHPAAGAYQCDPCVAHWSTPLSDVMSELFLKPSDEGIMRNSAMSSVYMIYRNAIRTGIFNGWREGDGDSII